MLPLPIDTKRTLGLADDAKSAAVATACESRSLLLDKYANPELKEADRNAFFASAAKRPCASSRSSSWLALLGGGLKATPEAILFAQLQSRLMLNMAGGVMENAGGCVDRFGVPYIPGSAVKGCARRMAIQQLVETREGGKSVQDLTALLVGIALLYGWGDTDWRAGRKPGKNRRKGEFHSDFEFACGEGESWLAVRDLAAASLLKQLGVKHDGRFREPWKGLPNFAGNVSFLPGYPVDVAGAELPMRQPTFGTLELDVVTCHHPAYYRDYRDDRLAATDDEDPNPVVFPAVAAGHVFAFAIRPLRGCSADHLTRARNWLAEGLATFGLGAKSAAGYGWFDTSPAIGEAVGRHLRARAEAQRREREAQAEKERQRQAEEARRQAREEVDKVTANMSDEEKLLYTLRQLQEPHYLSKLDHWKDLSLGERLAIYHLMRSDKSALWLDLRKKATSGKQKERARWGQLVQDLFRMAKDRKEKMPS